MASDGRVMAMKWKMLAVALAVGVLYTIGAFSTTWLFSDFAPGIVFFPSAGITVAALLLTPRRWWPLILSAVAIAEIAGQLRCGCIRAASYLAAPQRARSFRRQVAGFVYVASAWTRTMRPQCAVPIVPEHWSSTSKSVDPDDR